MKVKISSKKQTETKSFKKQTARKTVIKSIPTRNTLKKFAPLSIKLRSSSKQKWTKIALEGNFEVDRTFQGGPDDIFDPYYKFNAEKHHVWTDNLVKSGRANLDFISRNENMCFEMETILKFKTHCLDDPENHFYLKSRGEPIGHGLFAKNILPKGSSHCLQFLYKISCFIV